VDCTLHVCPATHPCPWTFISVLRSGRFDFAIRRSMTYPPHVCQSLQCVWKRSCLRSESVSPLTSFCPSKKRFSTSRENALGGLQKKETKQMHGRAGTERGAAANTRSLDNPKTVADRKHERSQSCRRQLHGGTLVFRGRQFEFSPSALRRSGAGGREERSLAFVAKVAVMQLCSYDESPTRRLSAMSLSRRSPFKEFHAHTHVLCYVSLSALLCYVSLSALLH
jgi:hypothetical protein